MLRFKRPRQRRHNQTVTPPDEARGYDLPALPLGKLITPDSSAAHLYEFPPLINDLLAATNLETDAAIFPVPGIRHCYAAIFRANAAAPIPQKLTDDEISGTIEALFPYERIASKRLLRTSAYRRIYNDNIRQTRADPANPYSVPYARIQRHGTSPKKAHTSPRKPDPTPRTVLYAVNQFGKPLMQLDPPREEWVVLLPRQQTKPSRANPTVYTSWLIEKLPPIRPDPPPKAPQPVQIPQGRKRSHASEDSAIENNPVFLDKMYREMKQMLADDE